MYYLYHMYKGKRIFWNSHLQRWMPHRMNASSFTEKEAKDLLDMGLICGIQLDKFPPT